MPFDATKTKGMTNNSGIQRFPTTNREWMSYVQELERHLDVNETSRIKRPVTKVKAVTEQRKNTTTVADDDTFFGWIIESNKYYSIEAFISVFQNVGNFKYNFQFDNVPTSDQMIQRAIDQTATPNIDDDYLLDAMETSQGITTMVDAAQFGLRLSIIFQSHADLQATMDFQWAQETDSSNFTNVVENSFITVTQLT